VINGLQHVETSSRDIISYGHKHLSSFFWGGGGGAEVILTESAESQATGCRLQIVIQNKIRCMTLVS